MAGLIPQSFIDDLLHRVDIVEVIDKRVNLKKAGKNYTACCPFHNEKTPSFSVQPEKQFYYCFGCGAGGNAIGFVMNYDGSDFPAAVESLARDAGLEVPREESKAEARRHSENNKLLDVLDQASRFYQTQLRQNAQKAEAVNYLKSRGLSGEIARDYGLGFAPPGWDNLLQAIGGSDEADQALLKAGMIIQKDNPRDGDERRYYDRFRHRIMFPIRDSRGRTVAFGGRVLGDDKPKYLNSPETPVFHKGSELYGLYEAKRAGSKFERILMVEGYMDVIALAQSGIRNAVATLGTATSERHLARLFRQTQEVVFCFDGDEAGRKAAWRALETTLPQMEDGRQVRFLFLPEGMDPDDYVRQRGQDAFVQAVAEATALEDYFYRKLAEDIDLETSQGKARLSNLAKPLLRTLPRGVFAQLMLDRLSETLNVDKQSMDALLKEQPAESETPPAPPFAPPPPGLDAPPPHAPETAMPGLGFARARQPARPGLQRRPNSLKAIELLLRNPELALTLEQDLSPLCAAEDESRQLLLALIEMVQSDPHTETYTLLGYCYGTSLGGQLTQLLKAEKITPLDGMEREFGQIIDSILSDIRKKLDLVQLKSELKSRVSAAKDRN
ncbi:MAG: DNA primase [Pseudohongiellaceae bacterium]